MSYPVNPGDLVNVKFPVGSQWVTVVECQRAGFTGRTAAGKLVTVRSYNLVDGVSGYVPAVEYLPINPGDLVTVTSGRGTKQVTVDSMTDTAFADTTGKIWSRARVRADDPQPKQPRRRVTKSSGIQVGEYEIDWNNESSEYWILKDGIQVYRSYTATELLNTLRELTK